MNLRVFIEEHFRASMQVLMLIYLWVGISPFPVSGILMSGIAALGVAACMVKAVLSGKCSKHFPAFCSAFAMAANSVYILPLHGAASTRKAAYGIVLSTAFMVIGLKLIRNEDLDSEYTWVRVLLFAGTIHAVVLTWPPLK